MKKIYEYTLRLRGGNRIITETIIACDERRSGEMLYFLDDEEKYNYCCSLHNLIDMKVKNYGEKENTVSTDEVGYDDNHTLKKLSNVLPKEK